MQARECSDSLRVISAGSALASLRLMRPFTPLYCRGGSIEVELRPRQPMLGDPGVEMTLTVEQIFTAARSQNCYLDVPISAGTLRRLYDTLKWGPTSANSSPARFAFVRSDEARQRLIACVNQGNVEKVSRAPVTVIVGMDMRFYDELPALFPHADARKWFVDQPELVESTAFRNSSLQGAYLIIAARALGLDCGPMSGFDSARIDAEFWAGTTVRTNFLCTLGKGDHSKIFPRSPRLPFEKACHLL